MKTGRLFSLRDPARVTAAGFVGLILFGTALLSLPAASTGPRLSFIDALFTACSAVCVTGLVVVDTGADLSFLGQTVVLILIQIGGLGIMTVSTILLLLLARPFGFSTYHYVSSGYHHGEGLSVKRLVKGILLFTLSIEALGAGLIFVYIHATTVTQAHAAWWAVFHAVSAFCNAGFGLESDSLVSFQGSFLINAVFMALIILGGLGFLVLDELWGRLRSKAKTRLSLHSKLVLSSSAILLLFGAVVYLVLESGRSLAGLDWPTRILISLFQSTTTRTAGFNTADLGLLSDATLLVMMALMFIGASPGSCGGGIKTTTLAVLAATVKARITGQAKPNLFNRSLSDNSVGRAATLMAGATIIVFGFAVLILFFTPPSADRGFLVKVIFETVSAFGTVGLSLGITPELTGPAKFLVVVLMFIGRLGPLTMVHLLARGGRKDKFYHAEESVMIG